MKDAWDLLEIDPTENKRIVKKAYAKMLAKYHPEDHPEEFRKIQDAYQSILNALNRTYQKTDVNTSDLRDGFRKTSSEYQTQKQDTKPSNEEREERSEFNEGQRTNKSYYDDLDLSWSFHDEPQTKSVDTVNEKIEVPLIHKEDTNEENLADFLYEHFLERITFSCTLDILKSLILNQTFFDHMKDVNFYQKITKLIQKNYSRFDTLTVSFLFDAFSYIQEQLGYSMSDEYSLTAFISVKKISHQKEVQHDEKMKKIGVAFLTLCLCLGLAVVQLVRKENKEHDQKKQEQIQNIMDASNTENLVLKTENTTLLVNYMQETYGVEYYCMILSSQFRANDSITFTCNGTKEGIPFKQGSALLGEDRLIKEVKVMEYGMSGEE